MDERNARAARRGETYGGRSRRERADDRRDRIVTAALRLFGTRDYETVSLADVCTAAKVSKRYFYEHFTDRVDLLATVCREQNDWLLTGIGAAAPEGPASAEELLRPMMRTLVGMLRANPERARMIYTHTPLLDAGRHRIRLEDARHFGKLIGERLGCPQDCLRYDRTMLALVAGVGEILLDWLARDMTDDPDLLVEHLTWLATTLLASATDLHSFPRT